MNFTYWTNFSKRKNSTLIPATTGSVAACYLKDKTDIVTPTIILKGHTFFGVTYGYIADFGRYYFVSSIVADGPNTEIHLVCDVLATYKADITASTQFVCYSSHNSSIWLPDTRIPIQSNTRQGRSREPMPFINPSGFYVLTVNGKNGCVAYVMTLGQLEQLVRFIDDWRKSSIDMVLNGTTPTSPVSYQWGTTEECLESLGKMVAQSGVVGNAYSNAPANIKSCIWVPFDSSYFEVGGQSERIYLGEFDTITNAYKCRTGALGTIISSLSIPWHYSDWRRATCETVYLYLPFAGVIQLSADSLTGVSDLQITVSVTATDGAIVYSVAADGNVIGTYGGSCSVNYPIGINQQASAGEITQSIIQGVEKVASVGVASTLSPVSMAATAATEMIEVGIAGYNVMDTAKTTHPSVIGSFGGGAAMGLPMYIYCMTVCHDPVDAPANMAATMGLPTMKTMSLSTLTGFCQCANGHVSAAAHSRELELIDTYINNGFYIE